MAALRETSILVVMLLSMRVLKETVTLPRLGGSEDLTQIPALAFNRFGQLQGASTAVSVLLGEKIEPTGEWRGSASNYYELRIQPLTGRVIVDDASL